MVDKVPYPKIMQRMHGDINYIAEEAYRDRYDHCEKEMRDHAGESYQRGLDDAWEAARKIALMDTETSDKFNDLSPVGRTAYISTMPDGVINGWRKTGNILSNDGLNNSWAFKGRFSSEKPLKITVEINDDMVVKITEDMVTDENTRFMD